MQSFLMKTACFFVKISRFEAQNDSENADFGVLSAVSER